MPLLMRGWRLADICGAATMKREPPMIPAPPVIANAVLISVVAWLGRRGNSVMRSVPRPSVQTLPKSSITDTAAEAIPTASAGNWRAAIHQYTKPSRDVIAVVPTREPEFANRTIFFFIHWLKILLTYHHPLICMFELCTSSQGYVAYDIANCCKCEPDQNCYGAGHA